MLTREEEEVGISAEKINPNALHPDMEPTGSDEPLLYVLGECPGQEEDIKAIQFCGKSGQLLRAQFPIKLRESIRFNNCCRTRTPENRTPTQEEIDYYRQSIIEDIEATKPKAVLLVGAVPLSWALPGIGNIQICRGRRFPLRIGRHPTWVYPIHHPSYILRIERAKAGEITGLEWKRTFIRDIKRVFHALEEGAVPPRFIDPSPVRKLLTESEVLAAIADFSGKAVFAFDLETSCLRPQAANANLLSIGLSDGDYTVSFPIDHCSHVWPRAARWNIRQALRSLFVESKASKIAHNLAFDLEWILEELEIPHAHNVRWHDTQAMGFLLDERPGGHNLDFLSRLVLGYSTKGLTKINVKKIEEAPLDTLLEYNGLDAQSTCRVFRELAAQVTEQGLSGIYKEHIKRIPTVVQAQRVGMLVDPERVKFFQKDLGAKLQSVQEQIKTSNEAKRFEKKFGKEFSPTSNPRLVLMFRDLLKRSEGFRGKKYSTDEEALSMMEDEPLAKLILEMRKLAKLKSTYVDVLDPTSKKSVVFPDGRIHPQFNTLKTRTGRLSSSNWNAQNVPRRKNAEIRSQIIADPGCLLIASDEGQLEARVIAAVSGDSFLIDSIKKGWDIHRDWAERIAKLAPSVFRRRGGDIEVFRDEIKNQLVFPAFYGSQPDAIAARLELTTGQATRVFHDFWKCFPGVRKWQRALLEQYQEQGYVESPTGRRYRAPLSENMILNYGIQGSASDIVVDAMNRLCRIADLEGIPYLKPILNVHDDLTFNVPKRKVEDAIEVIVREMLGYKAQWLTVPLEVKISVGPNWHEVKTVGKYSIPKP